jgi:hypothetical protein
MTVAGRNQSSLARVALKNDAPIADNELIGARYIVSTRVETSDSTVVLTGQGDREVSIRESELPRDRGSGGVGGGV